MIYDGCVIPEIQVVPATYFAHLKGRTHRKYRRKFSSKYNHSILVERHHMPLSKVYGVPTEG